MLGAPVGTKKVQNTSDSKRKVGRPSKKEQLEHVTIIRPYWRKGMTVAKCVEMLERNKIFLSERTVQTYYHEWNNILEEAKSHDIIEQEKEIKNRATAALEDVIEFLDGAKKDLTYIVEHGKTEYATDMELKSKDKTGKVLEPPLFKPYTKEITDLAKTLMDCHIKKFEVELEPTMDEVVEKQVADIVKEARKRHQQS